MCLGFGFIALTQSFGGGESVEMAHRLGHWLWSKWAQRNITTGWGGAARAKKCKVEQIFRHAGERGRVFWMSHV